MCKAGVILLILLLGLPVLLVAQENTDPSVETDWDDYIYDLYARGDQTFLISVGLITPTLFINNGKAVHHNIHPPMGGTGTIAFNYYFHARFFLGAELSGMFFPTMGGNVLFIIPLGLRAGTQFIVGRFEFPIAAAVGMSWHTYLDLSHYGLYLKAGGSALYRASAHWAFGVTSNWYWFPEWTGNSRENVFGNFLDFTLSARYQF
jgi:hypothetical protein